MEDVDDAVIVTAIITLAHSLQIKVIAEGVEEASQLAFLRAKGCDQFQGYYYSAPISSEGLTARLDSAAHSHATAC